MDELYAVGSNPEIDVLKAKISHLKAEINTISDPPRKALKYDDIVKILQKDISSFEDMFEFETSRKQKLLEEEKRLSKFIEEEDRLLTCITNYLEIKSEDNIDESIMDERRELFFKLEILHRKIITFMKKFAKRYFPPPPNFEGDDLFLSAGCADARSEPKKSLLDILSVLVVELGFERNCENATGFLKVDDTVPQEYIDMLMCAEIIERSNEDPSIVKLRL